LLYDFRSYWAANNNSILRNEALLFTDKSFINNFHGGIAYESCDLGNYSSYALAKSTYILKYIVYAHEIGHNINADDNSNNPLPSDCNCETQGQRSIMCEGDVGNYSPTPYFCPISINQISSCLLQKAAVLVNPLQQNLNLTGDIAGANNYQVTNNITSTQVIHSGITTYKAKETTLNSGFEVQTGAIFEVIPEPYPCP
jgi:hypothetical protein